MNKLLPIIVICALVNIQNINSQESKRNKQDIELAGYNIAFGVISSSIGGIINKPKGVTVWQSIKKSAWQGAVGGTLQYAGKKLTYQITRNENYWWGWTSKIVHSAGNSICYNAAMGNNFGKYWVFDYAAARINFHVDNGSLKIQPQFNASFLYDIYYGFGSGGVDWTKSLQTGSFTFSSNTELFEGGRSPAIGRAYCHSINYAKLYDKSYRHQTVAHELVHMYQANEYRIFNTYYMPLTDRINNKTIKTALKYIYVDIPVLHTIHSIMYDSKHYYRNYFEFEASFFSTNRYIKR